jgi:rhodanese-related sulfurtransferase
MLKGGECELLDVREPWEVETAAIEGATTIPMRDVPSNLTSLPRDKPVVVFCHHGGRSLQVVNWLRGNGFPDAINMAGGIDLWAREVDPSIPRY